MGPPPFYRSSISAAGAAGPSPIVRGRAELAARAGPLPPPLGAALGLAFVGADFQARFGRRFHLQLRCVCATYSTASAGVAPGPRQPRGGSWEPQRLPAAKLSECPAFR